MYTKNDRSHFNRGYYILDENISGKMRRGNIEIRAGSIVYARIYGVNDEIEISPLDAGYFDHIEIPTQKAVAILRKTQEWVILSM